MGGMEGGKDTEEGEYVCMYRNIINPFQKFVAHVLLMYVNLDYNKRKKLAKRF
jgi:hypothetical protein